jgi:4-methyl-5(b-hydroxyethyl)-thiazole monophosphate biosynthesis
MSEGKSPSPKALVFIVNHSEDIESVILIDVLRRAKVEVTVASLESELTITAARLTKITADVLIKDVAGQRFDLIVIGGVRATRLGKSEDFLIS